MRKLLVILDLDETLIHATLTPSRSPDFRVLDYGVLMRPGLGAFLEELFTRYEVALWTASTKEYANAVLPHLCDPQRFLFVWSRERCVNRRIVELDEWVYVKDLKKVKRSTGRSLDRVVLVDDSPEKAQRQYGNYIRVEAYEGDPGDRELPVLRQFLRSFDPVADVRPIEKRGWRSRPTDGVPRLVLGRNGGCYYEFQCQPKGHDYVHWHPDSLFLDDDHFRVAADLFQSQSTSFNAYGPTRYADGQLTRLHDGFLRLAAREDVAPEYRSIAKELGELARRCHSTGEVLWVLGP